MASLSFASGAQHSVRALQSLPKLINYQLQAHGQALHRGVGVARRALGAFFFGTEEEAQRNRDPLMETVTQYPDESLWFIKVVMLFGAISGFVISIPCLFYLWFFWLEGASCNRPLRYWVLFNCSLQLIQVPIRLVFFSRLLHVGRQGGPNHRNHIHQCLRLLTSGRAWKCSKFLSILNYGWFILGVVWVLNSSHCAEAPGLWKLTVGVIAMSMARLLITLVCFYYSFPPRNLPTASRRRRGATQAAIDALPVSKYHASADVPLLRDPTCSICLAEWVDGDELRWLPCNHSFHKKCVDKWLKRSSACPLCLRCVEGRDGHGQTIAPIG